MRRSTVPSFLLVLLASTAAAGNGGKYADPMGLKAHDTLTLTTKTTFTRVEGKTIRQGTRTETSTIEALAVSAGGITRAKVTRGPVQTSGKLAAVVWTADATFDAATQRFGIDFGDRTRAQIDEFCDDMTLAELAPRAGIVFDAGDGFTGGAAVAAVQHQAWIAGGVPLRSALAGKTIAAGAAVDLTGAQLASLYPGLTPAKWATLPAGTLIWVDGVLALATTVELVLVDGTRLRGELTGTVQVDAATVAMTSLKLTGDLRATGDATPYHVVIDQALTNNENITE